MADKDETTEGTEEKKGGLFENKALLLGIIVVVQVGLAIGLTQFLIVPKLGVQDAAMDGGASQEPAAADIPEMGVLVNLEDIVVTLVSDPAKPRYLRININVEVPNQIIADVVATRLPQMRDLVIMTLSDKTVEMISTPEGKKGLRDEIFRRFDEKMPEGTLMNIYFSDMVIQ